VLPFSVHDPGIVELFADRVLAVLRDGDAASS
jgi:hypothetical protein